MILILYVQTLPYAFDCDTEFNKFVDQFKKQYDNQSTITERQTNFCENYQNLITKYQDCDYCGVSSDYDNNFTLIHKKSSNTTLLLKKPILVKRNQKETNDCQQYVCAYILQIPEKQQYRESIDFRENGASVAAKDQGNCGSCWSFGVTAVMESILYSYQDVIKQKNSFWTCVNQNCSLSEQFIASNAYGFQDYCGGGNFVTAIDYIVQYFKTVELTSNFQNNFEQYKNQHYQHQQIKPLLEETNYFVPFNTFPDSSNYKIGVFHIFDQRTQSFDIKAVNTIKYMVSRGIGVAISIYADKSLSYATGNKVVYQKCSDPNKIDHQVTIVGYGRKDGDEVWVVRNSWGANWGSNGHFYLQIGRNSLCSEQYAYTLMPPYIQNFAQLKHADVGQQSGRGNKMWLDADSGAIVDPATSLPIYSGLSNNAIIGIVSGVILGLAVIVIAVYCICIQCKKKKSVTTEENDNNQNDDFIYVRQEMQQASQKADSLQDNHQFI